MVTWWISSSTSPSSQRRPNVVLVVDGVAVAPLEMAITRKQRRRGLLKRDVIDGVMAFPGINAVHTIGMRFAIDVAFCGIEIAGHHTVLRVKTMQPRRIGLPVQGCHLVLEAESGAFQRWGLRQGSIIEATPQ